MTIKFKFRIRQLVTTTIIMLGSLVAYKIITPLTAGQLKEYCFASLAPTQKLNVHEIENLEICKSYIQELGKSQHFYCPIYDNDLWLIIVSDWKASPLSWLEQQLPAALSVVKILSKHCGKLPAISNSAQ